MTQKLITVTLNTSIDLTVDVPTLVENSVVDADNTSIVAGGKGVNVARVLGILGEPVLVLGLAGKESAELFSTINSPLVHTDFVYVDGPSRQNITIVKTGTGSTTHIRTRGFEAQHSAFDKVADKLRENVSEQDIVILSGSLPPGMPKNAYGNLVVLCKEKGAFAVLDTSGAPFMSAISSKPFLVKPNLAELCSAFGANSTYDEATIMSQMLELANEGIPYVSVSLGPNGVLVLGPSKSSFVKANVALGTGYTNRKAVGSGDAMLAGFVFALKNNLGIHEMIRLGVACGAANVVGRLMNEGDLDRIKGLRDQVQVTDIRG